MMPDIDLVLFDVGGVLGTDGWDRNQRARAVERFGLDRDDFETRHQAQIAQWEVAETSMAEYLDATVFDRPRPFTREEFCDYIFAQSHPYPEMLAVARSLAGERRCRLMTLNNEPPELNRYRIEMFGLTTMFSAFLSSCYLAARKPAPIIYQRALCITQVEPRRVIFIDDRPENLGPAQALGMHTIHATSADDVRRQLAAFHLISSS